MVTELLVKNRGSAQPLFLQDVARQARAAQSQAKARAMAAADAAAQAEAKLAGQAMTGRNYMERIAQLKTQLHNLQQLVRDQASRASYICH